MTSRHTSNAVSGLVAEPKPGTYSINAQYEWRDGSDAPIVARYRKTVSYGVAGYRRNPNDNSEEVFMLRTNDEDFAFGGYTSKGKNPSYWRFNYENDVVELYSDFEHKRFLQRNKTALDDGVLVAFDEIADGTVLDADIPEENPFEEEEIAVKAPAIVFGNKL